MKTSSRANQLFTSLLVLLISMFYLWGMWNLLHTASAVR